MLKIENQNEMDLVLLNQSRVSRSMAEVGMKFCKHTYESALYEHKFGTIHVVLAVSESNFFGVRLNTNSDSKFMNGKVPMVFSIDFCDIGDVDIVPDSGAVIGNLGCNTLIVRINSTNKKYTLHCQQYSTICKRVKMSWQSWTIRSCAFLPKLQTNTDVDGTSDYYYETLHCLKNIEDYTEIKEILDEMSEDCLTDLNIKEIVFRSREIFSRIWTIGMDILKKPLKDYEKLQLGDGGFKTIGSLAATTKIYQSRLHGIVLQRLLVFRSVIKLFVNLLMNSEAIESRFNLFLGPHPLLIEPFIELLTVDSYKTICDKLGCVNTTDSDEKISDDISNSIRSSFGASATKNSNISLISPRINDNEDKNNNDNEYFFSEENNNNDTSKTITPVSSKRRASRRASLMMSNISEDILTPLKKRIELQKSFDDRSPFTLQLRQTVSDLQIVGLYETSRLLQLPPNDAFEVRKSAGFGILGDYILRIDDWVSLMEKWLTRVTSILDNFLVSDAVLKQLSELNSNENNKKNKNSQIYDNNNTPLNQLESNDLDPLMLPPSPSRRRSSNNSNKNDINTSKRNVTFDDYIPQAEKSITPNVNEDLPQLELASTPNYIKKKSSSFGYQLCPFETQETILFFLVSLILSLVKDSGSIREALREDLNSYFVPIMNVFNTICPHPRYDKIINFFNEIENQTLPNNVLPPEKFTSRNSNKLNKMLSKLCLPKSKTNDNDVKRSLISAPISLDRLQVDVASYGKAKYGLNQGGWTLLVLARRSIEEIIKILELDIPIDEVLIEGTIDNYQENNDQDDIYNDNNNVPTPRTPLRNKNNTKDININTPSALAIDISSSLSPRRDDNDLMTNTKSLRKSLKSPKGYYNNKQDVV